MILTNFAIPSVPGNGRSILLATRYHSSVKKKKGGRRKNEAR